MRFEAIAVALGKIESIKTVFFLLLIVTSNLNGQSQRNQFLDSKYYPYSLPYKQGRSYLLIQGYNSKLSHENELALDFKMKRGTVVCAARSGVVVDLKEDSDKGGYHSKYIQDGNYVILKHLDGSFAWYWHLKKNGVIVRLGDSVKVGDEIGLSGNSGYSAFPHLHFEVVLIDSTNHTKQIPTLFRTRKGIRLLKAGQFYRNTN